MPATAWRRRSTRSRPSSATPPAACSTTGTTRRPARSSRPGPTRATSSHPFLSTVDNGWLAAGAARSSARRSRRSPPRRTTLYHSMDFAAFFNPEGAPGLPAGTQPRRILGGRASGLQRAAPMYNGSGVEAFYTCHHYDTTVSESRIATYLGIANGSIPRDGALRHAPDDAAGLRLGVAGAAAHRHRAHVPGLRRLGGRLLLPRHELRPELGRQHVRVAHARSARARDEVGPALVAPEPPDHGRGAEAARTR